MSRVWQDGERNCSGSDRTVFGADRCKFCSVTDEAGCDAGAAVSEAGEANLGEKYSSLNVFDLLTSCMLSQSKEKVTYVKKAALDGSINRN